MRLNRLAPALIVPVLLLGVTACSGDDGKTASPTNSADLGSSSDTPSATPSADDSGTPTTEPTPEGTKVKNPLAVFNQVQAAMRKAGTAKVAMSSSTGQVAGLLSFQGGVPDVDLAVTGPSGQVAMEMKFVDGLLYVAIPGLTPDGKFFKFDQNSKALGKQVKSLRSSTPDQSAKMMAQALKALYEVGPEKIDGDATTHYVVVVDAVKAQQLAGQKVDPSLPETSTFDMWVTKGKQIRRIVQQVDGQTAAQFDYTDWGAKLSVTAPKASDVVKAPKGL